MTDRELVFEVAGKASEDATAEEIMYTVYVRASIERGLKDIEAGRMLTHEEVKRSLSKWLK